MRLKFVVVLCAWLACSGSGSLHAQQPLPATTVQLPTFTQFTVQTTVSVPDAGNAYLGGVNRGASGSLTRGLGPLRNRGLGSSRSASGISVSATVIDHEEIDRALLAAAARRGERVDPAAQQASVIAAGVAVGRATNHGTGAALTASAALPGSVAAIRQQNAAAAEAQARELADYFALGRQAESAGKTSVAKVYYQMVARRDSGQLKQQALLRLAALKSY